MPTQSKFNSKFTGIHKSFKVYLIPKILKYFLFKAWTVCTTWDLKPRSYWFKYEIYISIYWIPVFVGSKSVLAQVYRPIVAEIGACDLSATENCTRSFIHVIYINIWLLLCVVFLKIIFMQKYHVPVQRCLPEDNITLWNDFYGEQCLLPFFTWL